MQAAAKGGLDVIAITDHDSFGALAQAQAIAHVHGIRLVPGVEMTASLAGRELHLLGYFQSHPRPSGSTLGCFLTEVQTRRRNRVRDAVRALRLRGVLLCESDVLVGDTESYTRLHLARALVHAGYASDEKKAFSYYLSERHASVPSLDIAPQTVIALGHAHGGLVIWAHPEPADVERFGCHLVALGLDGIETHNFRHPDDHESLSHLAKRFGLLQTGGSDWHGIPGEQPLGTSAIANTMAERFFAALERAHA